MHRHDLITGLFIGIVMGLTFTVQLAPHLTLIVVLAVVLGAKVIKL